MRIKRSLIGYHPRLTDQYLALLQSESHWIEAALIRQERDGLLQTERMLDKLSDLKQTLAALQAEERMLRAEQVTDRS